MKLNSLSISCIRNLSSLELDFNPRFNLFFGENGSGKTSLLEAIHILTTGRSFRAHQAKQIISFAERAFRVSGIISPLKSSLNLDPSEILNPISMGIERSQNGAVKMKLAGQDCSSIALLAKALPIQLINSDSYAILEAAPQFRRQFLDWIMFHVEQSFYGTWRRFKRALEQRNAALRQLKLGFLDSVRVWDKELIETGILVDQQRHGIVEALAPVFSEILSGLLDLKQGVRLQYKSGWNTEYSLEEALDRSIERDQMYNYTTLGPHRADLEFWLGEIPAKNVLSRGQSKLFIYALLIARAVLLYQRADRRCVFLIDDLSAELDSEANKVLVQALGQLGSQVLITSVEDGAVVKLLKNQPCTFYKVKAGQIL